ncbi:hypothetical protein CDL12_08295 [Handroanthus impetiginosus]|uniref:Uncharacterized protein n=1 Tax=Handroanthus impetiginosus TaxID=429701 RepID=A0A2G9HNZ5_9LAMI|nr:hypothetical protein CDL12_08295 [Handroanthus impetiginosus]
MKHVLEQRILNESKCSEFESFHISQSLASFHVYSHLISLSVSLFLVLLNRFKSM